MGVGVGLESPAGLVGWLSMSFDMNQHREMAALAMSRMNQLHRIVCQAS